MILILAAAAAVPSAGAAPELLNDGKVYVAGDYPREAMERQEGRLRMAAQHKPVQEKPE